MKNYNLIIIKHVPPTNTKPSRVRLSAPRFNQSIVISMLQNEYFISETAERYLQDKGFVLEGTCEVAKGSEGIFTSTFQELK